MLRFLILTALLSPVAAIAQGVSPKAGQVVGAPDRPYESSGAYKWMQDARGDMSGTVVQDFDIAVTRSGIEITRGSGPVTIRDGTFRLIAPTSGHNLPEGVASVDAHDVLIENVTSRDFRMIPQLKDPNDPGRGMRYENGDCFSSEPTAIRVTYRLTTAINCSDGGYDNKAQGLLLDRTSAERAGISYRFWYYPSSATTITSISPVKLHLQLNSEVGPDGQVVRAADVHIGTLRVIDTDGRPLASLMPGTKLAIDRCELDYRGRRPDRLIAYHNGGSPENTSVTLGPGCRLG